MRNYTGYSAAFTDYDSRWALTKEMTQNLIDASIYDDLAGVYKFEAYVLRLEEKAVHVTGAEEGTPMQGRLFIAHLRPLKIDEKIIPNPCYAFGELNGYSTKQN